MTPEVDDPLLWVRSLDDRTQRTVMPSGLVVVSDHLESATSCAVSVVVRTGSRDDPEGGAGAAHFLEHLAFQGTRARSAREVNTMIDAVGGELNAYTVKEVTSYYVRVPLTAHDMAVDLLCELVASPRLDPHDVDCERDVIREELSAALDDPDDVAATALAEALYPRHPLGREVLGDETSLAALDETSLRSHHARFHRPRNLIVAAAGRVDHEQLVDVVSRWFDPSDDGGETPLRTAVTDPVEPGRHIGHHGEQCHLGLGWRAHAALHPDRYALAVLLHVLGDGPSSRLFRIIRDERGLAYEVDASNVVYSDTGTVVISTASAPRHRAEIERVIAGEIEDLAANGVASDELAVAVGYLRGATVLGLEDAGSRMARLAGGELVGRTVPVGESLDGFEAVTSDDVSRVAAEILTGPRAEVVVGPT